MTLKEVKVPDIGDYSNVDVIEVDVSVGEDVAAETTLITVETDKATMEIPSPYAGKVKEIVLKAGDKVSKGDVILKLESGDAAKQDEAPAKSASTQSVPTQAAAAASSPATPATPTAAQAVKVPDIGDYSNVDVIEVNVSAGENVAAEATLITVETDKATMEIPSPYAGKVKEIALKAGDKVSEGDVILQLAPSDTSKASAPASTQPEPTPTQSVAPVAAETAETAKTADTATPSKTTGSGNAMASPGVRRLARELEIDLSQVNATGSKGRVTKEDLNSHIRNRMQAGSGDSGLGLIADPEVDFAKFGKITTKPLSRVQKISSANLHRNWVKIPHITLFEAADITDMEAFRKAQKAKSAKLGLKLTPVPFLVKAVAKALHDFPNMNSSLTADGKQQVMKNYVHVGVAVDAPHGLVVPVIRDCDKKGLFDITRDFLDLVAKARTGKLRGEDMRGGCFTISSLGALGTTGFTPIVNMPEVGILGVSKAQLKPVYNDKGELAPRLMLPLSLSVDHRVIDGAEAVKFIAALAKYLSDIRGLLL